MAEKNLFVIHCYIVIAQGGSILNYAISEHVENAGVHSGDATLVLPAQKLYVGTVRVVKMIASQIAKALKISGDSYHLCPVVAHINMP